jgi:hydroxymethylbilane synthase
MQILNANPQLDPDQVVLETIVTTGDKITDRKLMEIGGKGLFTKEIEERLGDGRVQMAVHSMKDMPTTLPQGLLLAGCPKREDPRDVLITNSGVDLLGLAQGAVLGTASLRRGAQAMAVRPDIKVESFRGNVNTRIDKLRDGVVDATLLAKAGLNRLGIDVEGAVPVPVEQMLPAVGQGALALEIREGDDWTAEILAPLADMATTYAVDAERAFLRTLDGNCRTPLAAHAIVEGGELSLHAQVFSIDGQIVYKTHIKGNVEDADALGVEAARRIEAEAGAEFLQQLKSESA